jgi:hypothetical protein
MDRFSVSSHSWEFDMKVYFATAVLLAACSLAAPVYAAGAVAVAEPSDVARDGYAIGISYNYKTTEEAEERALRECRSTTEAPPETRKLCKVTRTFENQCAAGALDPKAGTPGAGWAIGETLAVARRDAVQRCEDTAGRDRQGECRVTAEGCDGKAK